MFIIVVEALIRRVKLASNSSFITPLRVARGAEGIAQLNFADDCLLFFRSSISEAQTIKDILAKFCGESGQKVNFTKSHIFFAPKIHHRHRRIIRRVLGIHEGNMPMKYLGITVDGKRLPR